MLKMFILELNKRMLKLFNWVLFWPFEFKLFKMPTDKLQEMQHILPYWMLIMLSIIFFIVIYSNVQIMSCLVPIFKDMQIEFHYFLYLRIFYLEWASLLKMLLELNLQSLCLSNYLFPMPRWFLLVKFQMSKLWPEL